MTPVGWEQPLLIRISGRDRAALTELYELVGPSVCDRALHLTGERLAAELITIGVFARVWNRPQEFAARGLRGSLMRLADQRAMKWMADACGSPGGNWSGRRAASRPTAGRPPR